MFFPTHCPICSKSLKKENTYSESQDLDDWLETTFTCDQSDRIEFEDEFSVGRKHTVQHYSVTVMQIGIVERFVVFPYEIINSMEYNASDFRCQIASLTHILNDRIILRSRIAPTNDLKKIRTYLTFS